MGQVDTSPAHNPVMLRIGALQNNLCELIQLAEIVSADLLKTVRLGRLQIVREPVGYQRVVLVVH